MIDEKGNKVFYILSDKPRLNFGETGVCKIFKQKVDAVFNKVVGVKKPKKIYRVTAELSFEEVDE